MELSTIRTLKNLSELVILFQEARQTEDKFLFKLPASLILDKEKWASNCDTELAHGRVFLLDPFLELSLWNL